METGLYRVIIYLPILLISLTIHEFCHGFVAFKKGDNTAKMMGRLTFNPLAHIDPFGTLLFPIIGILSGGLLFGWAKPVPVNPLNLKNRDKDMFWVAIAGPASNFVLAFFAAWIFGLTVSYGPQFMDKATIRMFIDLTQVAIYMNLALCFFNLIPIAPLDGSKIIGRFLPVGARRFFEQINPMYGMMLLFALIFTGALRFIAIPIFAVGNFLQKLFIF